MAVVQISRIQIRRGKINSGTGLPQLASGEMAWAVDSQELYIGNGSVSEGAPGVGNTKILTLNDLTSQGNILNLVTYIYKPNDITTITGEDANNPTIRTLQERLDEFVSVLSFGAIGDGVADDTVAIQRAIDQLYLNSATKASDDTMEGIASRQALLFPAGVYNITSTLYVPSYATLVGVGLDKSVISYAPTDGSPAIQFVNDTSTIGSPADISSTDYGNQPRGIYVNGLTISTESIDNVCMQLDCVRNSYFENIAFTSGWTGPSSSNGIAIEMNVKSSLVTCADNSFKNVKFKNLSYAVYANGDISGNHFKYCEAESCYQGFVLGETANGYTIGQQHGPRETTIAETSFTDIKRHAIYVGLGSKNSTKDNTYTNVGNDGGGNTVAVYPQVYFGTPGNTSHGDMSDRPDDLATANTLSVYIPEVAGHGTYVPNFYNQVDLGYQISPVLAFRLPIATDQNALPNGTIVYSIDYFYKSRTHSFSRRGTMTIAADVDNGNIQLSDEFDIACDNTVSESDQLRLDFNAKFMDQDNQEYLGNPGQIISTISVYYVNDYSADAGSFNYSYSASF